MESIFKFIKEHTNRVYFWNKLAVTIIILGLWIIDSGFFTSESNSLLATGLVVMILSTLTFGVIFKNHTYNEKTIQTFLLIDIVNCFVFVLPAVYLNILFTIILLSLLANIALFLNDNQKTTALVTYFILLIGMTIFYGAINEIHDYKMALGSLVLFSVVFYVPIEMGVKSLNLFEKRVHEL